MLEIPFGETTTETLGKIVRQALKQLLSIAGTRRALLFLLNDATANQPVRYCHDRINRSDSSAPGYFDDACNIGQQAIIGYRM